MSRAPKHPEDPGRDPEGLNPPRDILDAASGLDPDGGSFTPPGGDLDPLVESTEDRAGTDGKG